MRPFRANDSFRSSTFTLLSSVPITLESNNSSSLSGTAERAGPRIAAATRPCFARDLHTVPLEHLFLTVQRLVIGEKLRHNHVANRLAPAVLVSIGCGGLPALLTVSRRRVCGTQHRCCCLLPL
jgi:hypothetical protein